MTKLGGGGQGARRKAAPQGKRTYKRSNGGASSKINKVWPKLGLRKEHPGGQFGLILDGIGGRGTEEMRRGGEKVPNTCKLFGDGYWGIELLEGEVTLGGRKSSKGGVL